MFSFNKKTNGLDVKSTALYDGLSIFEKIKNEIDEAEYSIKIAAAWFTDNDLFQALTSKLNSNNNFRIEIVLDDNKENYWLPFMDLVNAGAIVKLSKGLGDNGRMHHKFCIIDDKCVISGSYNWSKNARNENHENVIISADPELVNSFKDTFNQLLEGSRLYQSENLSQIDNQDEVSLEINKDGQFTKEFSDVLDEMIFSTVVDYNRESLVQIGYERSEKCLGDANIITSELNTVYSQMLNSISVAESKKEILIAKVNAHLSENKAKITESLDRLKEELQVEEETSKRSLDIKIKSLKEYNSRIREEINEIEKSKLPNNNNRINQLSENEKQIKEETLKMPFRWYVDIPTYIGLLGVFLYIVLFYSSATYILMFAQRDADIAKKLGAPIDELGIYYSKAIPKALSHGLFETLFILFVPFFLVCGIIYLKKLKTGKLFPKWLLKLIFLIFIDGFTALAVTKSIHEHNYLAGIEAQRFQIANLFSETNFYLIFIFGMLSLLIFDLMISYVLNGIESRSEYHLKAKKKLQIAQIAEEKNRLLKENNEYASSLANKGIQIEDNLAKVSSIESEIEKLPTISKRKEMLAQTEAHNEITNLENITKIALNKIENELFSFSDHHMWDRINIFLQGWNNFIYSFFSTAIAERKINEAKTNSNNWFQEHFSKKANRA